MSGSIPIELKCVTSPEWVEVVMKDFDKFLQDHAACERKASATGVQFVVKYNDRENLVEPMLLFAREELSHFHQVARLMLKRGVKFLQDEKDPYVNKLVDLMRHGRNERLLDRLLVFAIVESRGHERFGLLAAHLKDPELKEFYQKITDSESRHGSLFIEAAMEYFKPDEIRKRLEELLIEEANILATLPIRAAVH